jgi:hypothetical protein
MPEQPLLENVECFSRRRLLLLSAAGAGGVAGCAGDGSEETPTEVQTATPTPTQTATPAGDPTPTPPEDSGDDALKILAGKEPDGRLLQTTGGTVNTKGLADRFTEDTGIEVETYSPYNPAKSWGTTTRTVETNRKNTDMMLTSRQDWKYRADEEDRETLHYKPIAQQIVERGGEPIGSVEYGMVYPAEDPEPLVGRFFEWMGEHGQAYLEEVAEENPYNFVPADAETPTFEPEEYHEDPPSWKGEFPQMWHGAVGHLRRHYVNNQLGEMKKMWMKGYNHVSTALGTEAGYQFAEDHGMAMIGTGPGSGEDLSFEEKLERARDYPPARGLYFHNEDFFNRIIGPMYEDEYRREQGEDVDESAIEREVKAKAGFVAWLQEHHGDLETLNERWGSSYSTWDEIGYPDLPLDWVERISEETGYEMSKAKGGDWHETWIYRLLQGALRTELWARNPDHLDFERYFREVWARKYKAFVPGAENIWTEDFENRAKDVQQLLEPREGEEVPGFIYTTKALPNVFAFQEVPEFNGCSYTHYACKVPPHYSQVPVDVQQIAQGKPVWNSEHHLYNHGASTPGRVRHHIYHTYLMGQFKSTSYNWRRITHDKRNERFVEATKARHHIRRNEEAVRAIYEAREDADIAVLYTEGNRNWNMMPEHPSRPDFGGAIQAYGEVGALGKPWKYVVNEDVSAAHVTDTLIVAAEWLTPETVQLINDLPEDRTVVVIGEVPSEDEYGVAIPEAQLSAFRDRATTVAGWGSLTDEVAPAEGLSGPYTNVRQANFYWWTAGHGRKPYGMPVPELEVRRGSKNGSEYVSVTNHSESDSVEAAIPWAAGREIRHLNSEDRSPRTYGQDETTTFGTERIEIYELL